MSVLLNSASEGGADALLERIAALENENFDTNDENERLKREVKWLKANYMDRTPASEVATEPDHCPPPMEMSGLETLMADHFAEQARLRKLLDHSKNLPTIVTPPDTTVAESPALSRTSSQMTGGSKLKHVENAQADHNPTQLKPTSKPKKSSSASMREDLIDGVKQVILAASLFAGGLVAWDLYVNGMTTLRAPVFSFMQYTFFYIVAYFAALAYSSPG